MAELIYEDLHFALSALPSDILKLMKDRRVIVAGGYIRAKVAGELVSDIDAFGADEATLESAAKDLALTRKGRYFRSKNAFTVLSPPRLPVQFIHRWTFNHPADLVESFDFSVARAAIWFDGSEFRSCCDPLFYPDLSARRLRYMAPLRNEDAGGSLLRVQKFLAKGYRISPESLGRTIARLLRGVNPDTELWATGIEADQAKVLTGLLRQVDPLTVIDGCELPPEEATPVDGEAAQ